MWHFPVLVAVLVALVSMANGQRTVPGYRGNIPLSPVARPPLHQVPSAPIIPIPIPTLPSLAPSNSSSSSSSSYQQIRVAGRIPTQLGSSLNTFTSRIGHEVGSGVGKIGAGVGEIPRAVGRAAGSVGEALGGTVGGVADSGVNEVVRVAESVGDTVREVPGAARQLISGLTRGSPSGVQRQKRDIRNITIDDFERIIRNYLSSEPYFCKVVQSVGVDQVPQILTALNSSITEASISCGNGASARNGAF